MQSPSCSDSSSSTTVRRPSRTRRVFVWTFMPSVTGVTHEAIRLLRELRESAPSYKAEQVKTLLYQSLYGAAQQALSSTDATAALGLAAEACGAAPRWVILPRGSQPGHSHSTAGMRPATSWCADRG